MALFAFLENPSGRHKAEDETEGGRAPGVCTPNPLPFLAGGAGGGRGAPQAAGWGRWAMLS